MMLGALQPASHATWSSGARQRRRPAGARRPPPPRAAAPPAAAAARPGAAAAAASGAAAAVREDTALRDWICGGGGDVRGARLLVATDGAGGVDRRLVASRVRRAAGGPPCSRRSYRLAQAG
jgi:hypothetical protein